MKVKKNQVFRATIAMVLTLLCVGVFLYADWPSLNRTLAAWNLLPRSEHFTELYFADPLSLPTSASIGHALPFAFVIHNEEGVTTSYPYEAYFETADGQRTLLASGTVQLADGAYATTTVNAVFDAATTTGQLVVELPSLGDQQIDLFLPHSH